MSKATLRIGTEIDKDTVVFGAPIEITDVKIEITPEPFDDRWCCNMCRIAEKICDFHESMEIQRKIEEIEKGKSTWVRSSTLKNT